MRRRTTLKLTSCQAPNQDFVAEALADYLNMRLSLPVEFVHNIPWQERERQFDAREIDVCWLCGLWYVQKVERASLIILGAPVMHGTRYAQQPVYFSDVVVRRDSPYQAFADLHGARWAYNETNSHSGYAIVSDYLARKGEHAGYFGQVVASGGHQQSLQMILVGEIDGAAIDSTVLEIELQRDPALASQIRVIETLGPSPSPPWVAHGHLPLDIRRSLSDAFWTMHTDPHGRKLLARLSIMRFASMDDADYHPIRAMARRGESVILE